MNEFDSFIQELLGNPNPKGNMFTGQFVKDQREDDYYKNPFRMQDSIDEAMRKKLAEEAAAKAAAAAQSGMLQQGGQNGGSSGDQMQLTADQIAFLDAETPMERSLRISNDLGFLGNLGATGLLGPVGLGAALGSQLGGAPVFSGMDDYSTRSTAAIQAQLQQEREAAALSARLVAEESRKREAAAQAAAAQQEAARVAAVQRAAQQTAANAAANYQSSNYQSYTPSGGGYTGMSSDNSNAGTSGSPSYGSGGFL